ncbi:DUF5320 domain-containing protein [Candidatus Oleimmundimicrobium sp.]|uniref:DUF5320 domain-containing protein n=1 Tax=Candidatus Oleimmundimicrobium sp. TaxID=3060597 RepID=UPI002719DFCE|nr:DUF5320 domain-containing protein [Candidatus Oleimmundimicrobium sp.]MDO8885621.1 DUF5320 domain-containing protein [Candidatus Oleimmundimicrobium sp.]
MSGFNGTGPRGEGPMTGGARGYCALPYESYAASGGAYPVRPMSSLLGAPRPYSYARPRLGLGFRRGGGFGRRGGCGRRF